MDSSSEYKPYRSSFSSVRGGSSNGNSASTPYLVDQSGTRNGMNMNRRPSAVPHLLSTPRNTRVLPSPHSAPPNANVFKSGSFMSQSHQLRYELDFADSRKACGDKSKGLRHFSTKVCEKVKEKGRTNYNEVADELVAEYFDAQSTIQLNDEKHQYDMKNIRRRVYDALNVLLAMNIIQKNKKDIHWVGLPTSSAQEFKRLEEDKLRRQERIREKTENLQEMIIQLVAYKTLVEKNREREREEGRPVDNSVLYLPYVIVNTEKRAMVECSVAHDKSEFLFNFDQPFEIHDDVEVLKRLGLAHGLERGDMTSSVEGKVKGCLPPALREYVDQIMHGNMQMMQRDMEKPVHYVIQNTAGAGTGTVTLVNQGDDKPMTSASSSLVVSHHPPPAVSLASFSRPPVVVARSVPGSRYTVVKPTSMNQGQHHQVQQQHLQVQHQQQPVKRYQQVVVRQPNGTQRVVLQAPPPSSSHPLPSSHSLSQQRVMTTSQHLPAPHPQHHQHPVYHHQQHQRQGNNASSGGTIQYEYAQEEAVVGEYDEIFDEMDGEENIVHFN